EDHLEDLILKIIRQHHIENRLGIWLEHVADHRIRSFCCARFLVLLRQIKTADWQKRLHDRALADRIDEMGVEDGDLVDLASQKFFGAKFRDRFRVHKARRVLQLEIGQQLAFRARDELSCLSAGDYEGGLGRIKIGSLAKQVRV